MNQHPSTFTAPQFIPDQTTNPQFQPNHPTYYPPPENPQSYIPTYQSLPPTYQDPTQCIQQIPSYQVPHPVPQHSTYPSETVQSYHVQQHPPYHVQQTPYHLPPPVVEKTEPFQEYSHENSQQFIENYPRTPNPFLQYHLQFKEDQSWVNNWLKQKITAIKGRPKTGTDNIKIGQAQLAFKKSLGILKQLKDSEAILKNNLETLSNMNWEKKLNEIDKQKSMLLSLLSPFDNATALKNLQKEVTSRQKKRNMGKQKKVKRREILKNVYNRRQQLHESIDRWLEEQKEQVERVKRAECMKRDADCILAEVNRKKSDARRHLNLIESLVKLRNVRETAAESRGERISLDDSNTFITIADRLKRMWEKALTTYGVEEHGLKVMLENRLDEKPEEPDSKIKNIIKEWDYALFGSKFVPSSAYWVMTYAQKDTETFIAVRKSWDTFITAYENGTKIPIGWIIPETPSSPKWEKYLEK